MTPKLRRKARADKVCLIQHGLLPVRFDSTCFGECELDKVREGEGGLIQVELLTTFSLTPLSLIFLLILDFVFETFLTTWCVAIPRIIRIPALD